MVAYQKYSLISILCAQGSRPRLGQLNVSIPYLCRPYSNLVQIAREADAEKFAATIAQMTPFLEKHNNMGLAKQVLVAEKLPGAQECGIFSRRNVVLFLFSPQALEKIRERNIEKFQTTFISLKLSSLASHLKLPVLEVENRLLNMIVSGQLSAQICSWI